MELAGIERFISRMVGAISNASLYSPEHAQVRRLVAQAHQTLSELLEANGEFSLLIIDGEIICEGQTVGNNLFLNRFAEMLRSRGIDTIRFSSGIAPEELQSTVLTLALNKDRRRESRSTEHIHLGTIDGVEAGGGGADGDGGGGETVSLLSLSEQELAKLNELYDHVRRHQRVSVTGMYEVVTNFIDNFSREATPFMALAPLRALDEYTFTHSTNVCILNIAQAMSLGIEGQFLKEIGIAAMLHDIGKLFIPEEVLTKPGKLEKHEWELMKLHPLKGANHLLDTPGAPKLAMVVAFEHHMRYDFSGYPSVPADWCQNLVSQMTAISDFFDAMRTRRSYRDAMEANRIASIMLEITGKDLHPGLTRNFFRILKNTLGTDSGPMDIGGADPYIPPAPA